MLRGCGSGLVDGGASRLVTAAADDLLFETTGSASRFFNAATAPVAETEDTP
jgi:hypothetical protein